MKSRMPVAGYVLLLGLVSVPGRTAQPPMPMPMPPGDPQAPTPAKAPGTIPPERPIFVPLWTDASSGGKEALASARATAVRLGAQPLLKQIGLVSRRARVRHTEEEGVLPGEAAGLTPRELDVLRLIAEGRTNPEIGKALYMSPKTASVHVSRILSKLDVKTRTEAAGVAHRLGLLDAPNGQAGT